MSLQFCIYLGTKNSLGLLDDSEFELYTLNYTQVCSFFIKLLQD